MRTLILIHKIFFLVCSAIFIASLCAVFTRGIEWLPFSAVSFLMSATLRRDCEAMTEEMETALDNIVNKIYERCNGAIPDIYEIEYSYKRKRYFVEVEYIIEGYEDRGAEYLGEYERLFTVTREDMIILSFDCLSELTGESVDCGFTKQDIQDRL